jgi:hypothetical protein
LPAAGTGLPEPEEPLLPELLELALEALELELPLDPVLPADPEDPEESLLPELADELLELLLPELPEELEAPV